MEALNHDPRKNGSSSYITIAGKIVKNRGATADDHEVPSPEANTTRDSHGFLFAHPAILRRFSPEGEDIIVRNRAALWYLTNEHDER
jgi:hypothetical protein